MRGMVLNVGKILVALAASVGLGWLAIRGLDWDLVGESFGDVSVGLVVLSLAVFMFASYLRAYRWRILFGREQITTSRLFLIQNEGIGVNNLIPVRIASEATQLAVLSTRDRIDGAVALATLGMERIMDVLASTLILTIAFFIVPEMKNFTVYVWGALGFAILVVGLVRFLSWGSEALSFVRRIPFLAAFTKAVRDLERAPQRLLASLLVSAVYWMLVGLTAWLAAQSLDLSISPVTATLAIMGTIFFATAIPALPSSVGTFEAAVVYTLDFFGVERSAGFAFAVLIHALLFLPPTLIAIVFLPREGILSFQRIRRLWTKGVSPASDTRA